MVNALGLSNGDTCCTAKISKYHIRAHNVNQNLYICHLMETPEDVQFGFVGLA